MELWRRIRNQKLVASVAHLLYNLRVRAPVNPTDARLSFTARRSGAVKVAFICDEMTWEDYRGICDGIFLHPSCWRRQLAAFSPDFIFCESAWCGIDAFPNVWRAGIYKDRRLLFENRKTLLEILDYCRKNAISTVFWNKEDPTFFDDAVYDFTTTALLFDNVFTTARECVPRYRARGHDRVFVLPFGVSEAYFHVDSSKRERNSAVFFGSYFRDLHTRCDALETLLDYVLEQGMRLDIYDRKSQNPSKKFQYPQKYQRYIRAAVPYTDSVLKQFHAQTYPYKRIYTGDQTSNSDGEIVTFWDTGERYSPYALENAVNAFKYTDCDYVTADVGVYHRDYTDTVRSKSHTFFWKDRRRVEEFGHTRSGEYLENGYSL